MEKIYTFSDKEAFEQLGHDPFNPSAKYDRFDQTLGGKPITFYENWSNRFLMNDEKLEMNRTVNMINDKKLSVYYSDRESYIRIYPQSLKAIIQKAKDCSNKAGVKSLVNPVNATLLYIMTNLKYYERDDLMNCIDADDILLIKLGPTTLLDECGIGKSNAKAVLSFLEKENIICKKDSNHYWVNYKLLFPGVRADYINRFQPNKMDVKYTRRVDLDKKKK